MKNHVHFIASPLFKDSLAQTFKCTHQRYSYYFHRRTQQSGHLWQGRFYSCLIEGQHLFEAVRYVEQNPVRANQTKMPWDYTWSSARAHMGKTYKTITLADIREILVVPDWKDYLAKKENEIFNKLIRNCTAKGMVLGSDDFKWQLKKEFDIPLIRERQGRPKMVTDTFLMKKRCLSPF